MRKYVYMLLAIAAMTFLMAGCSGHSESQQSGKPKKDITVRMMADPDFLDPHKATASLTFQMMLNVFEGLVNPAPNGGIEPGVAKSYKMSEDGLTYTFKLRPGIKFHNGDPVTVQDVEYSFDRLTGKSTGQPLSSSLAAIIKSVTAPDDQTIVIKLKKPYSPFLTELTAVDAAILDKKNDAKQNTHPIGTGPFKFVEYKPENKLVLEKFDDYWKKGVPYLNKVTFSYQPDDDAAFMSLKSGNLDLTSVPAHKVDEIKNAFNIIPQNSNAVFLMGFNNAKKPFNDVRVRQAINDVVNKQDIIDAAFSGHGSKLGSHMSPAMGKYFDKSTVGDYQPNVKKAKQLLKAAGYSNGFSMTITVSSHSPVYSEAAQVIVEELKQIGIHAKINVIEWAKWLDDVYKQKDYEATIIDFTGKLSPFDTLSQYRSNDPENMMNFSDEKFDTLMSQILNESSEDKRVALYKQAQEELSQQAPAVFICDYQTEWALNKQFTGFTKYPIYYLDLAHIKPAK
ncbi:diguanylate phosphodiesterase [Pullulanibacillus camelliae]|uniref:Diguanylate phosphodiesterase n=1 Tax=Pullulanibacillus camelliae TaxID=1707096 RepID=A0A8J2VK39_9BACL|nr:ABC transporter substrate-binding protein [Pullulanibacillus camelliae]GGE26345.1 diguanylate phosphodiesterase [Pullulanibacillus camelliae]